MGNKLFNIAYALLGADTTDTAKDGVDTAVETAGSAALNVVKKVVQSIVPVLFAIIALVGVIYGIFLGVQYAKAEDTQKREEAKKRLVNAIIGFGIAILAAAIMWILASQDGIWDNIIGS